MTKAVPAVLLIYDSLEGGLGQAVINEAQELRDAHLTIHGAGPRNTGAETDFSTYVVDLPGKACQVARMVRASLQMRRVVRNLQPTVIHCHGIRSFVAARPAAGSTPIFVTYHGDPSLSGLRRIAFRFIAWLADRAISVAPVDVPGWTHLWHWSPRARIRDHVHQKKPVVLEKVEQISCGDTGMLLRIGWFGRLDEPKRFDQWLSAVAFVADSHPDVRGVVFGDGPLLHEWKTLARSSGLSIDFVGAAEPAIAFRAMDIFLTWSDSEGVPFTMQESIAHGVLCFSNDLPGPRALLGQGSPCLLDSPRDERLLAGIDPLRRRTLAAEQRSRISRLQEEAGPIEEVRDFLLAR